MQFHSVRLRGMTEAFRNEAALNFDDLGPGLIAIVGENGAGKSRLIGCLFASLFRQFPGQRRPLCDFATCNDPEIDVSFTVRGQRFRSLLKINPNARQMESYLFTGDGTPMTNGKKEPFQDAVERLVGSRALYEASIFSNQKRAGNFLSLDRAQRKEMFVEQLLGLGRLRTIYESARSRGDEHKQSVFVLEGELKGLESQLAQQSDVSDPASIEEGLEQVSCDLFGKDAQLEEVQQKLADLQRRLGGLDALGNELQQLEVRARTLDSQATMIQKEIHNDELRLKETPPSNGEPARLLALGEKIAQLHNEVQNAQRTEAANRENESALRVIQVELTNKQREREGIATECQELSLVPCGGSGKYAACPKIRRAVESEKLLPAVHAALESLEQDRIRHQQARLPVTVTSAELMRRLQQAETERRTFETLIRQQQEAKAIELRLKERYRAAERLEQERLGLESKLQAATRKLKAFDPLRGALTEAERDTRRITTEVRQLQATRENLLAQKAQVERAEQQRASTTDRIHDLRLHLDLVRGNRSNWEYLAKVFGPDEIQLLEIQSAGPAISEIVNGLLEGCLDNKFEVRFRTQRGKADGRGTVDDFDVEVRNKMLDRSFSVDELSGGQFVLVNEALNLGIAMYNAQKGEGVSYGTLFRDETIGALDQRNGTEYVRLLRRALEIGGFHQIVFITHNPGVWELADRAVRVANGTVQIELGDGPW